MKHLHPHFTTPLVFINQRVPGFLMAHWQTDEDPFPKQYNFPFTKIQNVNFFVQEPNFGVFFPGGGLCVLLWLLLLLFCCTHNMQKFPGQALNLSHSIDNTESLTTRPKENFSRI